MNKPKYPFFPNTISFKADLAPDGGGGGAQRAHRVPQPSPGVAGAYTELVKSLQDSQSRSGHTVVAMYTYTREYINHNKGRKVYLKCLKCIM